MTLQSAATALLTSAASAVILTSTAAAVILNLGPSHCLCRPQLVAFRGRLRQPHSSVVSPLAPPLTSILSGSINSNRKRGRRATATEKRQRRLLFVEAWDGGGAQLAPLGFPLFSVEAPRLRDPGPVR